MHKVVLLVRRRQDLDDLLEDRVSVLAATVWALVPRRIGIELDLLPLNALRHDLASSDRVGKHAVAVNMHQHLAPPALDHLLPFNNLLANCNQVLLLFC